MQELLNTLDNFVRAGVDEIIQDKARNLLEEQHNKQPNNTKIIKQDVASKNTNNQLNIKKENLISEAVPTNKLILAAKDAADKAGNLEELKANLASFDGCALAKTANNLVFADGNENSDLLLIGEAPGASEDEQGIPFCGISGKLLDDIFKAIDRKRETNLYITNSIFWRPPGNRRPTAEEIAVCRPFVEKHIALIDPQLIILVGSTALNSIFPENEQTISKIRGTFMKYKNPYLDKELDITAIFHPSYLLRQPGKKAVMWDDMLKVRNFLQG